jgi:hypothetical protein
VLEAAGLPTARVQDMVEVLRDPQILAREHGAAGDPASGGPGLHRAGQPDQDVHPAGSGAALPPPPGLDGDRASDSGWLDRLIPDDLILSDVDQIERLRRIPSCSRVRKRVRGVLRGGYLDQYERDYCRAVCRSCWGKIIRRRRIRRSAIRARSRCRVLWTIVPGVRGQACRARAGRRSA